MKSTNYLSGESYAVMEGLEPRLLLSANLLITEFMAVNDSILADGDGNHSDWIEIYNPTDAAVTVDEWYLTDEKTDLTKWTFPDDTAGADTVIEAGEYLVVFASKGREDVVDPVDANRDPAGNWHTNFKLSGSEGEYLALSVDVDGVPTVVHAYDPQFPGQVEDISYGMSQFTETLVEAGDDVAWHVPTSDDAVLGTDWTETGFDDSTWQVGPTGLGFSDSTAVFDVTFYRARVPPPVRDLAAAEVVIADPDRQAQVITGTASVIDFYDGGAGGRRGHYGLDADFPGTAGGDVNGFVIEVTGTVVIPRVGEWTFGVNSDEGFSLELTNGTETFSMSYPGRREAGDTLRTFNFTEGGAYDLRLVHFEDRRDASLELFAAEGRFGAFSAATFDLVGDTASGGLALGGLGGAFATDVGGDMRNVNSSLWLRAEFHVEDPAVYDTLTLQMKYEDAFVAYVNGIRVVDDNAPVDPAWNASGMSDRPLEDAAVYREVSMGSSLGLLQAGWNVLAIHAMNDSSADGDFLILPTLQAGMFEDGPEYFLTPTPGAVNTDGALGFVEEVEFSVGHGFYEDPFTLTLATGTDDDVIRYTLDGSNPTSVTGVEYDLSPMTIDGTTTLRAAAFRPGYQASDVATQTYIFIDDVVTQSTNPGGDWPTSPINGQVFDYGMDPDIVGGHNTLQQVKDALQSISSISLVTDMDNLFDSRSGIYVNARMDGYEWERPVSMELIHPDDTSGAGFVDSVYESFQINAGLRIRGGSSRNPSNPKHSFRLFFRGEYGESKLEFPLFGEEGADRFDKIDLRTGQNFSWNSGTGDRADYATWLYDIFSRDTSRDMEQPYTRGRYYHLYLNGQYWGLYQTEERPEANYGESYMGGDDADYDALKSGDDKGKIAATDGTLDGYYDLWSEVNSGVTSNADYFRIQGMNVDGTPNPAYTRLLDVENLIDYMTLVFYGGNTDMPLGPPGGGTIPRNLFMLYNRENPDGVQFIVHDAEHSLELSRGVNFNYVNHTLTSSLSLQENCTPWWLHRELMADNAEYRTAFADRVHEYFFNDGLLTADAAVDRLLARAAEIESAIIAESARWGDAKAPSSPMTQDDWQAAVDMLVYDYMDASPSTRSDIVLQQFKNVGWYPSIVASGFNQHGGEIDAGFELSIDAPSGSIYYTLDGTDPRAVGGAAVGMLYSPGQVIALAESTRVLSRVYSGGQWSALNWATFYVDPPEAGDLTATELNYHPYAPTAEELAIDPAFTDDDFEFIELHNATDHGVNLLDVHFTKGVELTFTPAAPVTLGVDQYAVIVANTTAFEARYGTGVNVVGQYTLGLDGNGEELALAGPMGQTLAAFEYDDSGAWPNRADGGGSSLELIDPASDQTVGQNWRSSAEYGGSPGYAGAGPRDDVVINEVLTHTDIPQVDAIELHNTTCADIDVGGWYLSDTADDYAKFQIPSPTVIPAGGSVVLYEGHYVGDTLEFDQATEFGGPGEKDFAFSAAHGDDVWLLETDGDGSLARFVDHIEFGAAANGESFGLWPDQTGIPYPMDSLTLGSPNIAPRIGPLIISEVHYHPENPDGLDGIDADDLEFIEILNPTATTVDLWESYYVDDQWVDYPWTVEGFAFATGAGTGRSLAAGQCLVVVSFDPAVDTVKLADFESYYGVSATSVQIIGPYDGKLDNGGETVRLERPDEPPVEEMDFVPYLIVDEVIYDDQAPWPTTPDTNAMSLTRRAGEAWGDDPASWVALTPTPGTQASLEPVSVDLRQESDTGVSDTDNVTRINNTAGVGMLFDVTGTLAGSTITVYADGMPIGSAQAVDATTTVTTDGTYDLVDGEHVIAARQTQPGSVESADSAELAVTVDTAGPDSAIVLGEMSQPAEFLVTWTGQDDLGGSGVASYDVYVASDDGDSVRWQEGTTEVEAMFTGQSGHLYAFYSRARDIAGNTESAPALADGAKCVVSATAAGVDTLVTSTDVTLGVNTSLDIVLVGGGQEFHAGTYTLIEAAGGLTGTFASVTDLGAYVTGNGLTYDEAAGTVTLTLDKNLQPGDANLDGATDVSDRIIWNNNNFTVGTTFATGDFNGDGATDVSDRIIWNNYNFTIATVTLPAPTLAERPASPIPTDEPAVAPDADMAITISEPDTWVDDTVPDDQSLFAVPLVESELPPPAVPASAGATHVDTRVIVDSPTALSAELSPSLDAGLVDILAEIEALSFSA